MAVSVVGCLEIFTQQSWPSQTLVQAPITVTLGWLKDQGFRLTLERRERRMGQYTCMGEQWRGIQKNLNEINNGERKRRTPNAQTEKRLTDWPFSRPRQQERSYLAQREWLRFLFPFFKRESRRGVWRQLTRRKFPRRLHNSRLSDWRAFLVKNLYVKSDWLCSCWSLD